MSFPKFLIAGCQRCGTTSLNRMLRRHPQIWTPQREVHFFDKFWGKGKQWYWNKFTEGEGKLIGEKTPEYIYYEECLKRIKYIIPNVKFIVMLRYPADRANSYYRANKELRDISIEDCIYHACNLLERNVTLNTYSPFWFIERGIYYKQLKNFFKLFPRDNLRIVIFEKFIKQPKKVLNVLYKFLGIKREGIPFLKVNTTKYRNSMDVINYQGLQDIYRPYNRLLYDVLGYSIPEWEALDNA